MSHPKKPKNFSKQSSLMTAAKAALIVLTAIYPVFMVMMTGAGIISNRSSYGSAITRNGALLIVSGALLAVGAFFCLFRKKFSNIASIICSSLGFILCMMMYRSLSAHAKSAGWTGVGKYSGVPVADMYTTRILPVIAPFVLTLTISAVQLLSHRRGDN